ncbi:hypothetical protein ACLKA7_015644 [Drosophila subpalustris]
MYKFKSPNLDDSILHSSVTGTASSSSSSCSPLGSPQLIKSNSYSGTSSSNFPLEASDTSKSASKNVANSAVNTNEESSEFDAFLINSSPGNVNDSGAGSVPGRRNINRSSSYLRRNSCCMRIHAFIMRNWYLSYLVPISILCLVLIVGYLTRNYAKELLFWIETQNGWLIFVIFMALFTLVSFPIVVGYLVLLITAGYLFGWWKGWLTVILGANVGIAIAHATIRSFRHRISVHNAGVLQPAPPTIPISEFVKQCKPLSIPELRQGRAKETTAKWTVGEYLKGDPLSAESLVPEEINQHRSIVMDFLSNERMKRRHTHVLIVAGAEALPGYPFRQRSEFLYLCDCQIPGAVIVLLRSRRMELCTVICEPRREKEMDPTLAKIACKRFNVDQMLTLPQLKQLLCRRCSYASVKLWYTLDKSALSRYISELADLLRLSIDCPRHVMQYARSFKSPREMKTIRRAHAIASQSMEELISEHTPQHSLEQLRSLFTHKCQQRFAYQPLPYEPKLANGFGGVLLMDASCQYAGYCGSLARSWPICGRFTPPQKVIYNMLLALRYKLFTLVGKCDSIVRSPRELNIAFLTLLAEHLKELRVLPSNMNHVSDILKETGKFNCYPRLIKHIGLDLEESSGKLLNYPIRPGNVLSFQLSICIPQDCYQAYPEFRGVRCVLADSIHITEDHKVEILTGNCTSNGRNVEKLRNKRAERIAN